MCNSKIKNQKGFTLTEFLVATAILVLISFGIATLGRNIFFLNRTTYGSLQAQLAARAALRQFGQEVRESSPSSLGAYPLVEAATSSFTFYSDIDSDGDKDKVRYFISGKDFKKGTINPSGTPLTYNGAQEKFSIIAQNVVNSTSTPIFDYFSTAYTGTGTPMVQPISISNVRLIKMTLHINSDTIRNPEDFVLATQVTPRNIKDNL